MTQAEAAATVNNQDDEDYSFLLKNLILTQLKPSVIALGDEIDLSSILGDDWFDCNGEAADTNEKNAELPAITDTNPPISTTQRKWGRKRTLITTCSICQKTFPNASLLNRHMQAHSAKHKCPFCAKVFARKESKLKHVSKCAKLKSNPKKSTTKSAKVEPPRFACKECDRSFTRKENYAQHLMVHTGLHVVCDTCKINLSSFKSFKRHVKIHEASKDSSKLTCEQCPARFTLKWNLQRHAALHLTRGERSVCSKCGLILANDERVLREHSENETLNCAVCSQIFCLDTHLKSHLKSKHGNFWFRCKECSSSLTPFMTRTEYLLKKHVKNNHNVILNSQDCYKNAWYISLND